MDGPGPLARRALINGISHGRYGKGSIFVWSSGNGGRFRDYCNCDGYTNSIYTIAVSAATESGHAPWYLEECPAIMSTTYSSGHPRRDRNITTIDMDFYLRPSKICTTEHTGTSASSPLASGVIALVLESNPNLTWRDMQYLIVLASRPDPLYDSAGWVTNGFNRKYSIKFGFGLINAGGMVSLAEKWVNVPPQHICRIKEIYENRPIETWGGHTIETHIDVNGCSGTGNEVRFLEHVQCKITLKFAPRGNLQILLTSPMGTTTVLLAERHRDIKGSTYDDWPFLSVQFWGEKAEGRWTLRIVNGGRHHANYAGTLIKWQLLLYGTQSYPIRFKPDKQTRFKRNSNPDISRVNTNTTLNSIFGVNRCPPHTFLNKFGKCSICHESCGTCTGKNQDNCLTCSSAYFYVTDIGVCMQNCPDGYFESKIFQRASNSICNNFLSFQILSTELVCHVILIVRPVRIGRTFVLVVIVQPH